MKRYLQIPFILFVITIIAMFFYFDLNAYLSIENIDIVKDYFQGLGNWSLVYITFIHIILNITGIPRVFFTIFAGYVYGVFIGFVFSWIATMIGLIVTFMMVRYLFQSSFERKFGSKPLIGKINHYVDKYGVWSVIFLRAIYVVPSSILNYSFGFTKIKTSTYILGSAIGFLPVVFINVWVGNQLAIETLRSEIYNQNVISGGILIVSLVFLIKKFFPFQRIFRIW